MTKRKRSFPVGGASEVAELAEFKARIAAEQMPRMLELSQFLDAYGSTCGIDTLLSIRQEILDALILWWAGLPPDEAERMAEQCLPWWELAEQNRSRALAKLQRRKGPRMAIWRALSDLYTAYGLLPAGTVFSDLPGDPVPQGCPTGTVPSPYWEPLNADAVAQFYAAGPMIPGGSVPLRLGRAVTRWVLVDPNTREYALIGLGAGLPFRQLGVNGAAMGAVYP